MAAPCAPAAAEQVEAGERELELLTRQLPASADVLFAEAYPHREQAATRLQQLVDEGDERIEAAIGEALRLLDERAEASREGHWIGLALWESSVSPFDAQARKVSGSPVAAALRQQLTGLREEREERARRRTSGRAS